MSESLIVLDAATLTPDMLNGYHDPAGPTWDEIQQAVDVTVHPRTSADETIERIGEATMVLTNKVVIDKRVIDGCPSLKYVGVTATGVNVVDLDACRERDIVVTNVPSYSTVSVAQHVLTMMLEMNASLCETSVAVREGKWVECPDFSFTLRPWDEMANRAMGIIGLGEIGTEVGRLAHALNMEVYAYSRTVKEDVGYPVRWLGLQELFAIADVISLHCPLTAETEKIVNEQTLRLCRPSTIIINTGRGQLIDESALAKALHEARIGGAALDVLSTEPPSADNPLLSAPRCRITPHLAWASVQARQRLMHTVTQNVRAFLRGEPTNQVN